MKPFRSWLMAIAVVFAASPALAEDLLPPDVPVHEAIDQYIDAFLKVTKTSAAPQAKETVFVRRATLDLVGRIPTVPEVRNYLDANEPDKRARLVDRLMASPGFVRHQVNEFDAYLMEGTGGSIRDYLQTAFEEDRSWDRIFRELVMVEQSKDPSPEQKAAIEFLRQRVGDVDKLTNEVSVVFFGVNVSCAKCHDHPLVVDWTQDHFYGMKSFFSRTFENGGFLGEREYGIVKYKTTAGEERTAKLMFLSGTVLDEPESKEPSKEEEKKEKKRLEELKKKKVPPPAPGFSRRRKLIDVALRPGEDVFFSRAIVNRLFYRFLGQGLVMPLDQMHSGNPPSHPLLLEWLARDFREHGYDLRRLIRGIVLSRAYSRSSRWDASEERPTPDLLAVANVRPLMPQQLGASLKIAATDPEHFPADLEPEEFERRIESAENSGRGLAGMFELPDERFQVSVTEALLFSNSERIARDLLSDGGGRLVHRLAQIEDDREAIETAVWNIFSRPPSKEERKLLADYLAERKDRRTEGLQQIVWAMLTSSEFRFNY